MFSHPSLSPPMCIRRRSNPRSIDWQPSVLPLGPANFSDTWRPSGYIKMNFIAQAMTSPCTLLEWRTQLRRICDVTRHNFKWNICDVMKQKGLKEFYYGAMLNSFMKTLMYLKTNRLVLF